MDLHPRSAPIRCAYCHAELAIDERTRECPTCGTVLHDDCRDLVAACPTLGCAPGLSKLVAALPRRVSFVWLSLLIVLPSVPFALIAPAVAYSAADHLITGFQMMLSLWPAEFVLLLLAAIVPSALAYRWWSRGRLHAALALGVVVASSLLTSWTFWTEPTSHLGLRRWEQEHLAPRATSLRALLSDPPPERDPVVVDGYRFETVERVPEGLLLYTVVGGGPWPGWGILVPSDPAKPPSISKRGRRVTQPTSVPGLHWFAEDL